ncbi:MAG TPA: glycerophosphodiester phosphodiesterase family protein [Gemmataceae bacterium]|nr:glycerophosphodiester phosphodiesterase family protein [Gemmataceae bacterium]
MHAFDLQGHRGARGLKPENTFPGFEVALDLGVTTIETDVHLTRDGVPLLVHDALVSERRWRLSSGVAPPHSAGHLLISMLSLAQVREFQVDLNPAPERFTKQDATVTPLARLFAQRLGIHPYTPPTLNELFDFLKAYTGELGALAGKSEAQRQKARQTRLDLELKRVAFYPMLIGDDFDGEAPALLERSVVEIVHAARMLERTLVRSFDHRSVRALRRLEPGLTASILTAETALIDPGDLALQSDAQTYCPDFRFLDLAQVRKSHAKGVRVVPYTVNEPDEWQRLVSWEVDGVTTDYPDRLADWLRDRGIVF